MLCPRPESRLLMRLNTPGWSSTSTERTCCVSGPPVSGMLYRMLQGAEGCRQWHANHERGAGAESYPLPKKSLPRAPQCDATTRQWASKPGVAADTAGTNTSHSLVDRGAHGLVRVQLLGHRQLQLPPRSHGERGGAGVQPPPLPRADRAPCPRHPHTRQRHGHCRGRSRATQREGGARHRANRSHLDRRYGVCDGQGVPLFSRRACL